MVRRPAVEIPATRIGNDDPDFEGHEMAVAIRRDGRAYFVPRPLRNASPEQRDAMADIQALVRENIRVLEELDQVVLEAHEHLGLSWNSVGWLTGMSGRGAQKRWGSPERGDVE